VQKGGGCDSVTLYTTACWKPCSVDVRLKGFRGAGSLRDLCYTETGNTASPILLLA